MAFLRADALAHSPSSTVANAAVRSKVPIAFLPFAVALAMRTLDVGRVNKDLAVAVAGLAALDANGALPVAGCT